MAVTERQRDMAARLQARMRTLRKRHGWSQEKLARKIEMSRETVRAAESGVHLPEWATLERIAEAFGLHSVGELFGLSERVTLDKLGRLHAAA
jgi:DNA-binding XRE family transcriptional regulator